MVNRTEEKKDVNEETIFKTWADNYTAFSKIWADSCSNLYKPWIESTGEMFDKMAHTSSRDSCPEAYKEFYNLWVDTNKEIFSKYVKSVKQIDEMSEYFVKSSGLDMYKSWISALEKMSEKAEEMSRQTSDPEAYKEFYNLWAMTYEKTFDSFYEELPAGPMKEIMTPVKDMAKRYADTFARMSKTWGKPCVHSASAYPGKSAP